METNGNGNREKIKYYNFLIGKYKEGRNKNCSITDIVRYVLEQNNFENAIKIAVMSVDKSEQKHSHQRRLTSENLRNFEGKLITVKDKLLQAKTFDELFKQISQNKVHGIGEMLIYDASVRIGAFMRLFPEYIYIHCGTRDGLRNLFKREIKEDKMKKKELPEPFCSCDLTPKQLEDFFCIYEEELSGI